MDPARLVFSRNVGAPYRETRRIVSSGVPCWSWIKIQDEVRMRIQYGDLTGNKRTELINDRVSRIQSLLCKITDCRTTPLSTLNPFGEVTSGLLTLRGRLVHAKCCDPMTDTYHIDEIPIKRSSSSLQISWFDPDISCIL